MAHTQPRYEVADVVRAHGDEYRRVYAPVAAGKLKVLKNIQYCRTAHFGGHVDECPDGDGCGYQRISYNSCGDRHCPKCLEVRRAQWLTKRLKHLLPVHHFHVVFTIPDGLNPLALRNKKVVYNILFKAASQTLLQLARERLGAEIAVTTVLHTWGQTLQLHPHLHCVVTGGGLSADGDHWIVGRQRYFLPLKLLGSLFRGKFLAFLERARNAGELDFQGSTADLADPMVWAGLRDRLYRKDWIVYAKRPFGDAEQVIKYLGRYIHRVAISNYRIVDFSEGKVSFTYKDYRDEGRKKVMTLDALEFLRRFLLHVIPKRFVRIRYYGLCAPRNVNTKLQQARRLLEPDVPEQSSPEEPVPWWEFMEKLTGVDFMSCPHCGRHLVRRPARPAELIIEHLPQGVPTRTYSPESQPRKLARAPPEIA